MIDKIIRYNKSVKTGSVNPPYGKLVETRARIKDVILIEDTTNYLIEDLTSGEVSHIKATSVIKIER